METPLLRALLVLAVASLSAGLAWSGMLVLRFNNPWRVVAGVLSKACSFAMIRGARVLCLWLFLLVLSPEDVRLVVILSAVCLGSAPMMFAFLHFVPHFGWLVLGLLEGLTLIQTVGLLARATGRGVAITLLIYAASWLLVWAAAMWIDGTARTLRANKPGALHPRRLSIDEVLDTLPRASVSTRS